MFPHAETEHADIRRPQPPRVGHHVRRHDVPAFPGPAECRPAQAGRQHGAVPATALLHAGLRAADVARQPAVPSPVGARADAADVRRQEHDGGV